MPISPDKLYLVEPVLEWLDQGAPHNNGFGFNMNWFQRTAKDLKDYKGNPCGTACCMAGAIVDLNKLNKGEFRSIEKLGEYLGLTDTEVEELFYAFYTEKEYEIDLDTITPAQAAGTLREFIKTGKVVWD